MPYAKPKDVPAAVKKLSGHKRRVWRAAFNTSYANYKGDEKKAFATAWAAANKVSDAQLGEQLMPKDSISNRAQRWRSFREMIDAMNRKKIKDDDEGKTDTDEPEEVSEGQLKKKKGRKVNFAYGNDE